jgi:hypothetical protein
LQQRRTNLPELHFDAGIRGSAPARLWDMDSTSRNQTRGGSPSRPLVPCCPRGTGSAPVVAGTLRRDAPRLRGGLSIVALTHLRALRRRLIEGRRVARQLSRPPGRNVDGGECGLALIVRAGLRGLAFVQTPQSLRTGEPAPPRTPLAHARTRPALPARPTSRSVTGTSDAGIGHPRPTEGTADGWEVMSDLRARPGRFKGCCRILFGVSGSDGLGGTIGSGASSIVLRRGEMRS